MGFVIVGYKDMFAQKRSGLQDYGEMRWEDFVDLNNNRMLYN
jgi:hypothetical protein